MGFITSALGLGGGNPEQAQLQKPTTINQANAAYGQSLNDAGQNQSFLNALMAQNGIANQGSVFAQQQGLANQFQNVANGSGPNPALQQLQNQTGQNIASQAALAAGQRGSNANVGLMARQIGQQGAGIQQQAVGQGAALQAQQQLAGLSGLQQQQGMMANVAGQQVGQQGAALQNLGGYDQNQQQILLNSIAQQNNAAVGSQSSVNSANAATNSGLFGVLGSGLGGLAKGAGAAVVAAASGGLINEPTSFAGKHLKGFASGGPINGEMLAAEGKMVPGKAAVSGDSLKNDTQPAMLSPGEIVIPRHVVNSKDPVGNSAKFVQAVLAKQRMKRG